MTTVDVLPAEGARLAREENAYLLDVREVFEFATGHVDGSTLIPLGELGARHAELPKDRPIVVVCRTGNRSSYATAALRNLGYDARNLAGGVMAWAHGGLPLFDQAGNPGRVA